MKNIKTYLLFIFCLLLIQGYSQKSLWVTNSDGWVLRKTHSNNGFEKFFAIGIWGIPGYGFTNETSLEETKKSPNSSSIFIKKSKYFNLILLQSGREKDYMNEKIKLVGTSEIPWILGDYLSKNQFNLKRNDSIYYVRQKIKKDINLDIVKDHIDKEIQDIITSNERQKSDFIWAPFDEPASGGGWCWSPIVLNSIYKQIKKRNANSLVYIDLAGNGRGNSYLFEKYYLKSHLSMPDENAPYNSLNNDVRNNPSNLTPFNYSYNGKSMYTYKNGQYKISNLDYKDLEKIWYENIKETASGYQSSGDIFGINSYRDFFLYPKLAGITVDAIKAGIKTHPPVWLWFDSNGAYKPSNLSIEEYIKNIKCQIYTSIIHGATGVLFWSDLRKDPKYFDLLIPLIKELKDNLNVLYLKTIEKKDKGDLQYLIKITNQAHKYIIAVNTNTTDSVLFSHPLSPKKYLKPLEVYFSQN